VIRRLLQPDAEPLDDPSPGRIARIAGLAALPLATYGFLTDVKKSFLQHSTDSADKLLPAVTEPTTATP
jgi:hypothetical protein